jgi:hypothetical protein
MDPRMMLFLIVVIGGFLMVLISLWLIAKEKIFIDRESRQPVEIELKWLGRFKANAPALTLFVFACLLMIYPLQQVNTLERYVEVDTVPVKGLVEADTYPVLVYAVRRGDQLNKHGQFRIPVSFLGDQDLNDYRILLIVNGHVLDEAPAERKERGKEIEVSFRRVTFEPPTWQPTPSDRAALPEVPAEYRR